jgi:hypothetical protein
MLAEAKACQVGFTKGPPQGAFIWVRLCERIRLSTAETGECVGGGEVARPELAHRLAFGLTPTLRTEAALSVQQTVDLPL